MPLSDQPTDQLSDQSISDQSRDQPRILIPQEHGGALLPGGGYRKGAGRKPSMSRAMRRLLKRTRPELELLRQEGKLRIVDELALAGVDAVLAGDIDAFRLIWDRTDGPIASKSQAEIRHTHELVVALGQEQPNRIFDLAKADSPAQLLSPADAWTDGTDEPSV